MYLMGIINYLILSASPGSSSIISTSLDKGVEMRSLTSTAAGVLIYLTTIAFLDLLAFGDL